MLEGKGQSMVCFCRHREQAKV